MLKRKNKKTVLINKCTIRYIYNKYNVMIKYRPSVRRPLKIVVMKIM